MTDTTNAGVAAPTARPIQQEGSPPSQPPPAVPSLDSVHLNIDAFREIAEVAAGRLPRYRGWREEVNLGKVPNRYQLAKAVETLTKVLLGAIVILVGVLVFMALRTTPQLADVQALLGTTAPADQVLDTYTHLLEAHRKALYDDARNFVGMLVPLFTLLIGWVGGYTFVQKKASGDSESD